MTGEPKTLTEREAQASAILMGVTAGVVTPLFLWICGMVDFRAPTDWALRLF